MRVDIVVEQLARPVPGGIGVWVREVTPRLARRHAVRLVGSRSARLDGLVEGVTTVRRMPLPEPIAQRAWDAGLWGADPSADVGLWLSFGGPQIARRPPSVVVVHDAIFLEHPELYTRRGARWHVAQLEAALARATRLVAVDPTVADRLVALGARDRVRVVAPGADHLPPADAEGARAVLARAGVERPYLLVVGTLEPRKNLGRLVEAYQAYRARSFDPVDLVVVGPTGWGEDARRGPGVHVLGTVASPILAGLLVQARALAYVSLVEGFGLPVVEALHAAVPVVVSTTVPAARFGGVGVDPYDVRSITDGLAAVLDDERVRSRLVSEGLLAVEQLRWDRTAGALADVLEEVADG